MTRLDGAVPKTIQDSYVTERGGVIIQHPMVTVSIDTPDVQSGKTLSLPLTSKEGGANSNRFKVGLLTDCSKKDSYVKRDDAILTNTIDNDANFVRKGLLGNINPKVFEIIHNDMNNNPSLYNVCDISGSKCKNLVDVLDLTRGISKDITSNNLNGGGFLK